MGRIVTIKQGRLIGDKARILENGNAVFQGSVTVSGDTSPATAENVGAIRHRAFGFFRYTEQVIEVDFETYEWVPILVQSFPALTLLIKTDNPGTSLDNQFIFPGMGTYRIHWGDGSIEYDVTGSKTKTYAESGEYLIQVQGLTGINFNNTGDRLKLIELREWGLSPLGEMQFSFFGCANAVFISEDVPLGLAGSLGNMFRGCTLANPDTTNWDFTNVTSLAFMFQDAVHATPNTANWNTPNVTSMQRMFHGAILANPDTANWLTGNVLNMERMFQDTHNADPDVTNWDVSKVTDMDSMFQSALVANPNTTNWVTSSLTKMAMMFNSAPLANPITTNWDVSKVTSFSSVFRFAVSANPNVTNWDTALVTTMFRMFQGATVANPNLSNWVLNKNLTTMANMLDSASISVENYSRWLINCAEQVRNGGPYLIPLGASGRKYNDEEYEPSFVYPDAEQARLFLTAAIEVNVNDATDANGNGIYSLGGSPVRYTNMNGWYFVFVEGTWTLYDDSDTAQASGTGANHLPFTVSTWTGSEDGITVTHFGGGGWTITDAGKEEPEP